MSDQFSDLILIAGITVLVTLLWAASVVYTYWDTQALRQAGRKTSFWMALVVLLPFIGFTAYILYRTFVRVLSSRSPEPLPRPKRETALKRPAGRRSPLPTYFAADLERQTIADPDLPLQTYLNLQEVPARYQFMIFSGAERGKEFIIENLPARIGRGSGASIRLDQDLGVSRNQAELYEQAGALRIRDLNSTHGTLVNGFRIHDAVLQPGDVIKVGLTELVLKVHKE